MQGLAATATMTGALGLSGCGNPRESFHAMGSSTLVPPTEEVALAFMSERPDLRFDVSSGGTSIGLSGLQNGSADIAMIARKVTDAEAEGLNVRIVAHDHIAVIKHRDTPIPDELSLDQCRDLFSGSAGTGGVLVFQKSEGHGTRQAFASALNLSPDNLRADAEVGSNGQMIQSISRVSGVGYVSHVDALAAVAAGMPIDLIRIDGVQAGISKGGHRKYPIVRSLSYACHVLGGDASGSPSQSVIGLRRKLVPKAFIDFAIGPVGQNVFENHGFIPVWRA